MSGNTRTDKLTLHVTCLLTALGLLTICSKSSPLYPFNDWPDVNCFYTVGKGMIHGLVPYVNYLEQKGPYVYALGAIAYLLDGNGFHGYFLFELFSMYIFLLYAFKISSLYCEKNCLWLLPLLGMTVVTAKSFVHGGSIEQLSLGIFAYAIYSLLALMRAPHSHLPARTLFLNGLLAGVLLWSKFTLMGLYIAWVLTVVAVYLHRKQLTALRKAILLLGSSTAFATFPWLVYFGLHGAVKVWLKVYLYDNIFLYGASDGMSLLTRCISTLKNIWDSLFDPGNLGYSLPLTLGICFFLFASPRKVSLGEKLAICFMGIGMAAGIFIGSTKHDYYGLPLATFTIWGMWLTNIIVGRLQTIEIKRGSFLRKKWFNMLLWGCVMLCALYISYYISPNTYLLLVAKTDMPQYRFAAQILASEDTSLLNYLFLDGGFYTVTGEIPREKTFCLLNMDRPRRIQEQQEYLQQQCTHWVVTWRAQKVSEEELRSMDVLSQYYELADYQYFYFEGDIRTYALYEKKSL